MWGKTTENALLCFHVCSLILSALLTATYVGQQYNGKAMLLLQQKWLRERAKILCLTYMACLLEECQ